MRGRACGVGAGAEAAAFAAVAFADAVTTGICTFAAMAGSMTPAHARALKPLATHPIQPIGKLWLFNMRPRSRPPRGSAPWLAELFGHAVHRALQQLRIGQRLDQTFAAQTL